MSNDDKLSVLLSEGERAKWRSLPEFITYVEEIDDLIWPDETLKKQAQLRNHFNVGDENRSCWTRIVIGELHPLRRFAKHYLKHGDNLSKIRHLGRSDQVDAEIKFSDGIIQDIEVTLTDFTEKEIKHIKQLNEKEYCPDSVVSSTQTVVIEAVEKILAGIQRKFYNNQGCWMLINLEDALSVIQEKHYEGIRKELFSHAEKDLWFEHFDRIFVVGNTDKFFLEITPTL